MIAFCESVRIDVGRDEERILKLVKRLSQSFGTRSLRNS